MTGAIAAAMLALVAVSSATAARARERRRLLFERMVGPRGDQRRWPSAPAWFARAAAATIAGVVGAALAGPPGSIAGIGVASVAPRWLRARADRRRRRAIDERLPEAVSVIASAMRSGRSLPQALELVSTEVDEPLGPSLGRVMSRVELGDPLDDAIEAWAGELEVPEARLTAGVLRLHRRTGGALAAALEQLSATLRARRNADRELASLSAQARLSATILGLLPIGFFLFMSVVAREDLRGAYETPLGLFAIALGLALQAAAYVWIRRLLRIEP